MELLSDDELGEKKNIFLNKNLILVFSLNISHSLFKIIILVVDVTAGSDGLKDCFFVIFK